MHDALRVLERHVLDGVARLVNVVLTRLHLALQPTVCLEQLRELRLQPADLRVSLRLLGLLLCDALPLLVHQPLPSQLPARRGIEPVHLRVVAVIPTLAADVGVGHLLRLLDALGLVLRLLHRLKAPNDQRLELLDPRVDLPLVCLEFGHDLVVLVLQPL